jgi:hypothetical protein
MSASTATSNNLLKISGLNHSVEISSSTQHIQTLGTLIPHNISASTQQVAHSRHSGVQDYFKVSTQLSTLSDDILHSKIETIFRIAREEFFEDGMESTFSRELNYVVKQNSNKALEIITHLIVHNQVNSEVAGEALRWLGRIDSFDSYPYRRWLLERSLALPSNSVKDGAIIGLAAMDDRHAIPYLKKAIEKEQCIELKADMELVLEQLEN